MSDEPNNVRPLPPLPRPEQPFAEHPGFWATWRMIVVERFGLVDKATAQDIESGTCPREAARYALVQMHRCRDTFGEYDATLREALIPHRTEAAIFALEHPRVSPSPGLRMTRGGA